MSKALERQQVDAKATGDEEKIVTGLRSNALRSVEIEADLLEKAANAGPREVPQALRAVADVKAKSLDKLLALTGRAPVDKDTDLGSIMAGLAAKGLVKVNVEVKPPAIEGTATNE